MRRGRPFTYSDLAIGTLLTLRELFRLPYRQTEGLGRAFAKLIRVDIPIPHHTSLVKRAGKLGVSISLTQVREPVDVVVDSTGLKVCGEGEWKVRQHGVEKHRDWRKVHLAVDLDSGDPGSIDDRLASTRWYSGTAAAGSSRRDAGYVCGDGAYDLQKVYDALEIRFAWTIIPPRKNAKADPGNRFWERDASIQEIQRNGREAWNQAVGYHRRSLAETAVSRRNGAFGDCPKKTASHPTKNTEVAVRAKLLDWFVTLGMSLSLWI